MTDVSVDIALNTFRFHGIDVPKEVNGSHQAVVETCPFCGDERKLFFISAKPKNAGQFNCKKCGLTGNRYVFLQLFYEHRLEETTDEHYKKLAEMRETKHWQAFRSDQWAYDDQMDRWLYAIINETGSVVNLKAYLGPDAVPKVANTTGCSQHLYGMEQLKKEGPIIICEGEADATMLRYIWHEVDDRLNVSILAVPGKDQMSTCCKKDIKQHFANRDIILLYDSGEEAAKAQLGAASLLSREYHARSVLCINWPESFPPNTDITDLINQKGKDEAWAKIQSWLRPHNHKPESDLTLKKIGINGVLKEFRESGVHVSQSFADAIVITMASIASMRYGGIPIWIYLIGPPGSGKSLILDSTVMSPVCHYQTDLKYQTLVSGFKTEPDPSLLARINNRVIVIKDWTTILDKNEVAQKELLGILREAYDGVVVREYGNGVIRIYPDPSTGQDRCYFGIVGGVTPKIHTQNKSSLGERFLKCELGRPALSNIDIVRRAIKGSSEPWLEVERANHRQQVVSAFLESLDPNTKPPSTPAKYEEQLAYMAEFAAVARTRPERDRSSGDLLYEAAAESASRLGKQFQKLAQSIALVKGLKSVDQECMRLVRKVAWNTSTGWHRNVYSAIWRLNAKKPTASEIALASKLTISTTSRVLMDLRDLSIIEKGGQRESSKGKGGRPSDQWRLTNHGHTIGKEAKVFGE